MRTVFLSWSACIPHTYMVHHAFHDMVLVDATSPAIFKAWAWMSYVHSYTLASRRSLIKYDKRAHLISVTAAAEFSASRGDNKALYRLARNLSQYNPATTRTVKDSAGSNTKTSSEFDKRFLEFFQTVFDARVVSSLEELGCNEFDVSTTTQLAHPSSERVEKAISKLPNDKSLGPDGIPAEILKLGQGALAAKLFEIIRRIWSTAYWPLQWRGGRLKELLKKGSKLECDNYRGLLISNHVSKAASDILDEAIEPLYDMYVPTEQCGATKKRSTDMATHIVRGFIDLAALRCMSCCVIYIDLIKAFDCAIRETVIGSLAGPTLLCSIR